MRGAKILTVGATVGLTLTGMAVEFVEGTHPLCIIRVEICAPSGEPPVHMHEIDIATP